MTQKLINCLYSHFKNSPQKLKIVCDWDEVIQPLEPKVYYELSEREGAYYDALWWKPNGTNFEEWFQNFWKNPPIYYSEYGSHSVYTEKSTIKSCLTQWNGKGVSYALGERNVKDKVDKIKNESSFYQQTPFLTMAKELLKLIQEGKVEKLIFLSAYDKRKFPNGDARKPEIFKETFGKFPNCYLELIGFESEGKGVSKADWIKENAADFNVVVDDNPNICRNIILWKNVAVCSPYYPAIENQHHPETLLIKTSVSDLKKENFTVY